MKLSDRQSAAGRNQQDLHVICQAGTNKVEGDVVPWFTLFHVSGGVPEKIMAGVLSDVRAMVPRGKVNVGRMHGDSADVQDVFA